ncbi:Metalloenzyme, LuxS/M16 peptidase-like protein [Globomyces pollinis-pini]|nr:Metalloenzyme, LuxS/M16 peptidase-like protein [Globomyces pollinis-pini]
MVNYLLSHIRSSSTFRRISNSFPYVLKTPQLKDLQTSKIQLENGMNVVLLSDPQTPTSGAALSVEAGSWHDGKYNGTAHFLEHMLFLGTKKFPNENDYERFIYDSNGSLNAYTSNDHSMYYFDSLNPSKLSGALDRFSRFFYEPLFNESCVSREMNAVDEEYQKNKEVDGWRLLHVRKALAPKEHPFSGFNTGNLETMKLINRDYLKNWFTTHYSADKMNLVIHGKESLDELESMTLAMFSNVPASRLVVKKLHTPLFQSIKGQVVWIEPVKQIKQLSLSWEVPEEFLDLNTKPLVFASYIIGHEAKKSLLSNLKDLGYAESLSAYHSVIGLDNVLFEITISLTEKGLQHWKHVVEQIHSGLRVLFQTPCPKYLFDELNMVQKMNYEFQQRSSTVALSSCSSLRREGIDTFPFRSLFIQEFKPESLELLYKILVPENSFITVMGKNESIVYDNVEKWMGARYTVFPFESSLNLRSTIDIPHPNPYIPKNLSLLNHSDTFQVPQKLKTDAGISLYYYPDHTFLIPKSDYIFIIKTPKIDPENIDMLCTAALYLRFVTEEMNEISYYATTAGLSYNVWLDKNNSIGISVSGYSEKSLVLLESLLDILKSPRLTMDNFMIYRSSQSRQYQNRSKNSPLQQASETYHSLILSDYFKSKQLSIAVEKIQYEHLVNFSACLFESYLIEAFVGGNVSELDAVTACQLVKSKLNGSVCSEYEIKKTNIIPYQEAYRCKSIELEVSGNALVWSTMAGPRTDLSRCSWEFLDKLVKEPFYSELRTKQQTGYSVSSGSLQVDKHLILTAHIQSSLYDPRDLLSRVEMFYESFLQEIHESKDVLTRFESIRASTIERLNNPFDRMSSKNMFLNYLAYEENGDFGMLERRIKLMENYTIEDLRSFAVAVLGRQNKRRLSVLATGNSSENTKYKYIET